MGKNKLQKFSDMDAFPHVFQYTFSNLQNAVFPLKGKWNNQFFKNNHPIILELGCGRGEYTVALANMFPNKNFIGVDIKGSRMWTGAKQSYEEGLTNVAFLRTDIELIAHFFEKDEIDEIWLTFPDPQMKKLRKRLTSTNFIRLYQQIMKPEAILHLKTDSHFMFTYTTEMIKANDFKMLFCDDDIYKSDANDAILSIKTYYEQQWINRGLNIKYLKFILSPKINLVEPDVEIELDPYRSYNRNSRSQLEKKK